MSSSYRSAFREALQELELALKARDGLERRVAELKDALPVLANLGKPTRHEQRLLAELLEVAEHGTVNLTRAVRLVLAMAGEPLTTIEIRDRLVSRHFSFAGYSNPMAAIHSALNRMVAAGEAAVQQGQGRAVYAALKKGPRTVGLDRRTQLKKAADAL